MRADIAFTPAGLAAQDVAGRAVFVVDVLRATTTISAALHHGARAVVPVASTEEAVRLQQTLGPDDVLLAGEQGALTIPGFQAGNSPREMLPDLVRGKTVAFLTTNGTRALLAVAHAREVYAVAATNFSVTAERARAVLAEHGELLILCAGRENTFSLDDAYVAGRLLDAAVGRRGTRSALNDAALAALDLVRRYRDRWERPFRLSRAGRDLARLGLGDDVADAARQDAYPVLAQYRDRRVTAVAP